MIDPSIFRPYNVRGRYPSELNEDAAYLLAQAFAKVTGAKKVAVGRDARLSGPTLEQATMKGLLDLGVDVIDLGMITTDTLYYVAGVRGLNGIQVSASHNPAEWNGVKFIKNGCLPLSDNELQTLYKEAQKEEKHSAGRRGTVSKLIVVSEYTDFLFKFIDAAKVRPLRVVANPLNGTAGPVVAALGKKFPITIIPLNMEADGRFPKGTPDPFIPAMRKETAQAVKKIGADMGVSWDNDADRIAFFDENGEFVPGAFVTALFARYFLEKHPGAKIVSETRVIWPVKDAVEAAGGTHIVNKPGHAFLKDRMRKENAAFGGELSGHYFFKDFWYADNGFIPFLLMLEILSTSGEKLSGLVNPFRAKYFFSEETNFEMERDKAEKLIDEVETHYRDGQINRISGLSVAYSLWRFNLRPSDNEPKLRLTVEARNQKLLEAKTAELTEFVKKLTT